MCSRILKISPWFCIGASQSLQTLNTEYLGSMLILTNLAPSSAIFQSPLVWQTQNTLPDMFSSFLQIHISTVLLLTCFFLLPLLQPYFWVWWQQGMSVVGLKRVGIAFEGTVSCEVIRGLSGWGRQGSSSQLMEADYFHLEGRFRVTGI